MKNLIKSKVDINIHMYELDVKIFRLPQFSPIIPAIPLFHSLINYTCIIIIINILCHHPLSFYISLSHVGKHYSNNQYQYIYPPNCTMKSLFKNNKKKIKKNKTNGVGQNVARYLTFLDILPRISSSNV